jgi:hypothetical protein
MELDGKAINTYSQEAEPALMELGLMDDEDDMEAAD